MTQEQLNNRPFKIGLEGLVRYINWHKLRSDYNLQDDSIHDNDLILLEEILNKFINSNK